MRRTLVLAGAALGTALAVTGCRAAPQPPDHDLDVSRQKTGKVSVLRVHRPPAHPDGHEVHAGPSAIRDRMLRDVPAVPGRRATERPGDGCVTADPARHGRGVSVRCAQQSGQDIDRSEDTVVRDDPGSD